MCVPQHRCPEPTKVYGMLDRNAAAHARISHDPATVLQDGVGGVTPRGRTVKLCVR